MPTLTPLRALPVGYFEYTLTIVLDTERNSADLATDAVLAMLTSGAALRQSAAESGDLLTLRVRYGATSDVHAHQAAAAAVQMALGAGEVNGATVMAGARFVVAAHASLV